MFSPRERAVRFVAIVGLIAIVSPPVSGVVQETPFDPVTFDVGLEPVATGLDQPLFVTHAGDDRLFVVERGGTIRIIQEDAIAETPFLDISDRVGSDASERGLLAWPSPRTTARAVSSTSTTPISMATR